MTQFICKICGSIMDPLVDDLFICKNCELISSNIRPDLALYDKSYQRKYERYAITEIGKKILNYRLSTLNGLKDLRVLDFGCGAGDFHRSLTNGTGFDINPFSECNDIGILFRKYDIVTFWDSLEHLINPVEVASGFNAKYIFFCSPCYDDFINGGDKKNIVNWHHYYPGEHIHYFNEKAAEGLINACGYDVMFKDFGESKFRTSGGGKNIITMGGVKRG
jgi:SAM-dependent methyltransferase